MAINVLVTRDGATVLFRGPNVPWAGQLDFTLEALVYGGVLGLRILAIFGTAVFLAAAVDTDELLRALRRVSLRSGVTAALAMRLFGVLAARRGAAGRRAALPARRRRLAAAGAARGHDGRAGPRDRRRRHARGPRLRQPAARPPRMPRPWSRHDLAFAASAVVLLAIAVGGVARAVGASSRPTRACTRR